MIRSAGAVVVVAVPLSSGDSSASVVAGETPANRAINKARATTPAGKAGLHSAVDLLIS